MSIIINSKLLTLVHKPTKTRVKRGPWSPEEDDTLKNYVQKYGTGGNWIALPHKAGLQRCGKSCRLRWLNYLRPDIKHGGFTEEEDNFIVTLYASIGSRWSVIASQLPGRTDNDVKNHWNTKLKKKLPAGARTGPKIPNSSTMVPINFSNSNNFAPNSINFISTTSLPPVNQVQANYYGNSAYPVQRTVDTLPHSMDVIHCYPEVAPDLLYMSPTDQFPLPGLTEVQENGTLYDGLIPTSTSLEISTRLPSCSLAGSYASWNDAGIGEELGIFVQSDFKSSNYDHDNHTLAYAYPMASICDIHAPSQQAN